MKNLFQISSTYNNPRFIFLETIKSNFENDKLDLLNNIHNELMKSMEQGIDDPKKQLAKARKITSQQEAIEWRARVKELEIENAEGVKNLKAKNASPEEIKNFEKYKYFDPTFPERFISGKSLIYPQKNDSWFKLISNSNRINSAKATVKSNDLDNRLVIYNLLQTNENIQKVANYLEKEFGTLKKTDSVGIWFDEKAQKTMIYFKRNGKTTTIPFQEIK